MWIGRRPFTGKASPAKRGQLAGLGCAASICMLHLSPTAWPRRCGRICSTSRAWRPPHRSTLGFRPTLSICGTGAALWSGSALSPRTGSPGQSVTGCSYHPGLREPLLTPNRRRRGHMTGDCSQGARQPACCDRANLLPWANPVYSAFTYRPEHLLWRQPVPATPPQAAALAASHLPTFLQQVWTEFAGTDMPLSLIHMAEPTRPY